MLAPLFLVVLACSLTIAAGTVSSGSPSAGAQRSALAVRPSAWNALLKQARDLGASRAVSADVLVALRQSGRPTAFLRWAAQRGLRASWFPGQPMVLLTAPPAILGRALGVRIDGFRLTGHGVFYASRGGSHVPALLRREVAALGRISSFGQVHTEGIPVGGLAPGGLRRRL